MEGLHLIFRKPRPSLDDGACVSHALSRRRSLPGNKGSYRLGHFTSDVIGSFFFVGPTNFPDQDHPFSMGIGFKHLQHIDKTGAVDWIAADPNAGAGAKPSAF